MESETLYYRKENLPELSEGELWSVYRGRPVTVAVFAPARRVALVTEEWMAQAICERARQVVVSVVDGLVPARNEAWEKPNGFPGADYADLRIGEVSRAS